MLTGAMIEGVIREQRSEGLIGSFSKAHSCSSFNFLVSGLWKILSHLCYWLLFTYFRICQTVKKMERDRTVEEDEKGFGIKKNIFFLSVVTRAYASSPEPSQAPRGILDQGFLAQTRFQKTEVPLSHTLEAETKPKQLGE